MITTSRSSHVYPKWNASSSLSALERCTVSSCAVDYVIVEVALAPPLLRNVDRSLYKSYPMTQNTKKEKQTDTKLIENKRNYFIQYFIAPINTVS